MTIGAGLFTITVGAVLAFAVTAEVAGIDLQIVGYILLVVGVLGLLIGLWMTVGRRRAAQTPSATTAGVLSRRRSRRAAVTRRA